jgi:branched-chain amino acid aminotransferase
MGGYSYFEGQIVPDDQAKISIKTHAFNYGTGCFEGIRGYWNDADEQLYLFRLRDHYERLERSCRILGMRLLKSADELCETTLELVRKNAPRQDVYIRPIAYKSSEIVGVRMHDIKDELAIFTVPFGKYLPADNGCRCATSSYRRVDDNAIPARAKVTGIYVNSALAKSEAILNGFDEAIMLTHDGHVSEGSGENIFLVLDGKLVTPASSENILVGITRDTVIEIARAEFGIETVERQIDRSELWIADECFMTGTAAEISPIIEVDRRVIGDGSVGPIANKLRILFNDIVRGRVEAYQKWCTPTYSRVGSQA